jgi:hypothetical protein
MAQCRMAIPFLFGMADWNVHARFDQCRRGTGFFVVYPNRRVQELVVEHCTNAGVLDCVVGESTPTAIDAEIVKATKTDNCEPACTSFH